MYSKEEREKAIRLYIKYGKCTMWKIKLYHLKIIKKQHIKLSFNTHVRL